MQLEIRQNEEMQQSEGFDSVLSATGRSPEIDEADDVYGWLVGSWELEVLRYKAVDVASLQLGGEAHFGWVLEGRAMQDVWIMPARNARSAYTDKSNNMFGTTLRVWDATIRAWRISWTNPVSGHREEQIGRKVGADIVQIGARANGTPTRWRFTEISANSFHWIGESLSGDGQTWLLEGEFRARRKGTQ